MASLNSSVPARPQQADWARLIPGEAPVFRKTYKKPPQSVRPVLVDSVPCAEPAAASPGGRALEILLPTPLRSRAGKECLSSVACDGVLIILNWFFLAVTATFFQSLIPAIRPFPASLYRSPGSLAAISVLHAALITLIAYTEGLYTVAFDLRPQAKIVAKAVLLSTLVLSIAYTLQGASRNLALWCCFAGLWHFGTLQIWRRWRRDRAPNARREVDTRNILIVGAGAVGHRLAEYIEHHPACGRKMCGFLDDETPPGDGVVGRIRDLAAMARRGFVDEVILAAPRDRDLTLRVLRESKRLHLDLEIIPELFGCDPSKAEIEQMDGLPLICVHAERLPAGALVLKRVIDLLGSSIGLALLLPILLAIGALIRIDTRGPALYVAERAGRKGRLFRCFKFRTMVCGADGLKASLWHKNERAGPIFKIADDPRITRVGRWLRLFSLDELPQLWNVLKGEMSLVGPRPHPLDEFAAYDLTHLGRLDVTPGMTGLWQVSARRDPSFERAMDLDREYIRTWSLGLDLRILLKTVAAVACGSGN